LNDRGKDAADLRGRAEERLEKLHRADEPLHEADAKRLLHELRVHQVELELQNEELQASRLETEALLKRYSELFEFAPIGFFHIAPSGTIRESNFAGARLLGLPRGALAGRSIVSFAPVRERRSFERFLEAVLTGIGTEAVSEARELVLLRAGSEELLARVTGSLIEGGPAPTALLAVEDVTGRAKAENALREEVHRRDDFLAALSHELRNPLAPIRNALTIVERLFRPDGA
jgi:PAS domain S-box-containing protein